MMAVDDEPKKITSVSFRFSAITLLANQTLMLSTKVRCLQEIKSGDTNWFQRWNQDNMSGKNSREV